MENIFTDIYQEDEQGQKIYKTLINGCWDCVTVTDKFRVTNPATGEEIAQVPSCSAQDAKNAIQAADEFEEWGNYKPVERLNVMEEAAEILEEHQAEVRDIIIQEAGKPLSVAEGEVEATIERLKLTLQEVRALYGEYIPGEWVEDTQNKFAIVRRKPLGIVAAIGPFNYPLFITAAKIIPAVLAGNTVVAKPSSETPLSVLYFVRILEAAGMPKGTINVVTGSSSNIGDPLIQDEAIDAVTFTGSTGVGEYIADQVGVKKLHLELGGNAAAIVLNDADLDNAVQHICKGAFKNSGQRCDAMSRVLVQKDIKEEFMERLMEEAANYEVGDPFDEDTLVGPLINHEAVERVDELVQDAVAGGADILRGAQYDGNFYEPTILDNVTLDMDIAWEEIFGPVLPIIEVEDHHQALDIANRSEYGLDSSIFTENITIALRLSKEMKDGTVSINSAPSHGVGHFPFGGNKRSGIGREGLKYSIDELTKINTVIFNEK